MKVKLKVMNAQTQGPYKILDKIIGKGSFGIVKLGINENTGKLVAIKIESKNAKHKHLLPHENRIIKSCQKVQHPAIGLTSGVPHGIVHSRYFWENNNEYCLVMDLLGPSIDSLHRLCSRSFSLKTTLMLATQMLEIVHYYHKNDVIHRDIKPANFLINYAVPHKYISLVDFGLAKKYKVKGKNIPFSTGASQAGSLRYMSKYVHNSIEPSCRDDMYSLGYCIIFLFTGILPWQGASLNKMDKVERKNYVGKLKNNTSNKILVTNCRCRSCGTSNITCSFQEIMLDYFDYLDTLEYNTHINYEKLAKGIRECFKSHGYVYDNKWDWTKYYIT